MSNVSINSSSQGGSTSGSNGSISVEPENNPSKYPEREYELEDFSQQRINRGQQEINYLIVAANEKILHAVKEFRSAMGELAGPNFKWDKVDAAIDEAVKATAKIAGPFPPGCVQPLR